MRRKKICLWGSSASCVSKTSIINRRSMIGHNGWSKGSRTKCDCGYLVSSLVWLNQYRKYPQQRYSSYYTSSLYQNRKCKLKHKITAIELVGCFWILVIGNEITANMRHITKKLAKKKEYIIPTNSMCIQLTLEKIPILEEKRGEIYTFNKTPHGIIHSNSSTCFTSVSVVIWNS